MAWIYKKPKTHKRPNDNEKKLAQKYVYNTSRWIKLRTAKLMNNPLCEECKKNDKIEPAIEIHHIKPFMEGTDINQIIWLGFDYTNLQSLCKDCHKNKHTR
jgi:5-methylcytosine-specific restriction enzyme A